MASNYEHLYYLERNQYLEDCPVIICAGAILKHKESGNIVAQIKFQNVDDKPINALKVKVRFYSPSKEQAGEQEYIYLDLDAKRDDEFGSKQPLMIEDDTARSLDCTVVQVVFKDGTVWNNDRPFSGHFNQPQPLKVISTEDSFFDAIKDRFGIEAKFIPQEYDSYWTCICGAINKSTEKVCHKCGNRLDGVLNIDYKNFAVTAEKDAIYEEALGIERNAKTEKDYLRAIDKYESLKQWKDAEKRIEDCRSAISVLRENKLKAEQKRKQAIQETKEKVKPIIFKRVIPVVIIIAVLLITKVVLKNMADNTIVQINAYYVSYSSNDKAEGVELSNDNYSIKVKAIKANGDSFMLGPGEWSIEEPVTLEADKISIVRISYKGLETSLVVECSTSAIVSIRSVEYRGSREAGTVIDDNSDFSVIVLYKNGKEGVFRDYHIVTPVTLETDTSSDVEIEVDKHKRTVTIECSTKSSD